MLPPELFDTILDDVHELDSALDAYVAFRVNLPQKTLPTCALVCKSWLPRARHLGFQEVLLRANDDPAVGLTLCTLLDHPLCTFRPYVRTLRLSQPYRSGCPSKLLTKRHWFRTVLPRLATLPNVEGLHLREMWFYNVAETDWVNMVIPLFGPHLKELSISSTFFTRRSDVLELVSRCTQLEALRLADLTMTMGCWSEQGDAGYPGPSRELKEVSADRCFKQDGTVYPRPSRELREVSFVGEEAMDVVHWLLSTTTCTSPPPLSTIAFENVKSPSCILVARCLDIFGSSITSLTLGLSEDVGEYTDTEDLFCQHANPSSLTHLRTIQFGPLSVMAWTPDTAAARHIASILSEIGSTGVREITFGPISCLSVDDMSLMDWDTIISILNRPTYSRLEALRLVFWEKQEELCEAAGFWLQHVRGKLEPQVEVICSRHVYQPLE